MQNNKEQWILVGWLVDGQGGPVQKHMVLGLRGPKIFSAGPWRPEQPITHDFSHATILPPLMDSHVHLVFGGTLDARKRAAQLNPTPVQAQAAIRKHLEQHWHCGVTAVRDGGDRNGEVRRCKQQSLFSPVAPVHVSVTCWAWHRQGRYGKMIGRSPLKESSLSQAVQAHLNGVDHIKVIQSGLNSIDRFGEKGAPQFSKEELQTAVKAAHDAGLSVMVHANGQDAVGMAIAAGCDSIEHGYFMGDENLRRMAGRGTLWVPTVIPMAALAQAPGLTTAQQDVARRTVEHQLDQIRKAYAWGVPIALGTDAGSQGVDHGVSVWQELQLLMTAGFSLQAAVRSATAHAARLMGLADRGELLPGRQADFIVVPGTPEGVIPEWTQIEAKCINGQWYSG
jgi:imidazolonepropionase-like amidohydrolase